MSIDTNTPENLNFQSPLNFKFYIHKAPTLNFFVQKVNMPGILGVHAQRANPFVVLNETYDHLEFENLRVTFKIDEDFKNFLEVFTWIMGIGFPEDYAQYEKIFKEGSVLGQGIRSNISLQLLNSKHNFNLETVFLDAFPVELSGFEMNTTEDDVQFLTTTATFKYTNYVFKSAE